MADDILEIDTTSLPMMVLSDATPTDPEVLVLDTNGTPVSRMLVSELIGHAVAIPDSSMVHSAFNDEITALKSLVAQLDARVLANATQGAQTSTSLGQQLSDLGTALAANLVIDQAQAADIRINMDAIAAIDVTPALADNVIPAAELEGLTWVDIDIETTTSAVGNYTRYTRVTGDVELGTTDTIQVPGPGGLNAGKTAAIKNDTGRMLKVHPGSTNTHAKGEPVITTVTIDLPPGKLIKVTSEEPGAWQTTRYEIFDVEQPDVSQSQVDALGVRLDELEALAAAGELVPTVSSDPAVVNLAEGGLHSNVSSSALVTLYNDYAKTVLAPIAVPDEVKAAATALGIGSGQYVGYVGGGGTTYYSSTNGTWAAFTGSFSAAMLAVFTFIA